MRLMAVWSPVARGRSRRPDLPPLGRGVRSGLPTPPEDEVRDRQDSGGADDRDGCRSLPTARASSPFFAHSTISPIDTTACSGMATSSSSRSGWVRQAFARQVFTAVPFLRRMIWRLPDICHRAGYGRGRPLSGSTKAGISSGWAVSYHVSPWRHQIPQRDLTRSRGTSERVQRLSWTRYCAVRDVCSQTLLSCQLLQECSR
jgi:hypothetical protein